MVRKGAAIEHPISENESKRMKIAIQGEPGSFSHEAALKLVPGAAIVPCPLSAEVFAALATGKADAAAIPIENSLAGSVSEHFDLLLTHDVKVEQETLLRIRHNLIAITGVTMADIDRVFSHPVALAQCRRFLAEHPRHGGPRLLRHGRQRQAAGRAARPLTPPPSPAEAAAQYYGAEDSRGRH